jgi:hypothetical protein
MISLRERNLENGNERLVRYPDNLCTQRTADQAYQPCATPQLENCLAFHKLGT